MERPSIVTKRISKSQRESHSEIERKRRERMKRDTEFLRKQVSNTQCKDKLSIFQAGAEKLIQYTDKLGKREYIINDEEYSQIIMSNFDGFDIHVRCLDGKVLKIHDNVKKILDVDVGEMVGRSLQDLAEPSHITRQIINNAFCCTDLQWDIFKDVIARNFTIALRCGSRIPSKHCIYGCDGKIYRFIEFCGDLVPQTDGVDSKAFTVFRGLCRPLDPVSSTVIEPVEHSTADSSSHVRIPSNAHQFTLRVTPGTFLITEVVGDFQKVLGVGNVGNQNGQVGPLLNRRLQDVAHPSDRADLELRLVEVCKHRRPVTFFLRVIHFDTGTPVRFEVRLSPICLGAHLHCFVCRFTSTEVPNKINLCPISSEHVSSDDSSLMELQQDQLLSLDPEPRTCTSSPVPGLMTAEDNLHTSVADSVSCDSGVGPISVLAHVPSLGLPTATVEYKAEHALLPGHTVDLPHCLPDQSVDESWFHDVDTSSFQSLLDNCNPTGESLSPDYLLSVLPTTDTDIGQ